MKQSFWISEWLRMSTSHSTCSMNPRCPNLIPSESDSPPLRTAAPVLRRKRWRKTKISRWTESKRRSVLAILHVHANRSIFWKCGGEISERYVKNHQFPMVCCAIWKLFYMWKLYFEWILLFLNLFYIIRWIWKIKCSSKYQGI